MNKWENHKIKSYFFKKTIKLRNSRYMRHTKRHLREREEETERTRLPLLDMEEEPSQQVLEITKE